MSAYLVIDDQSNRARSAAHGDRHVWVTEDRATELVLHRFAKGCGSRRCAVLIDRRRLHREWRRAIRHGLTKWGEL